MALAGLVRFVMVDVQIPVQAAKFGRNSFPKRGSIDKHVPDLVSIKQLGLKLGCHRQQNLNIRLSYSGLKGLHTGIKIIDLADEFTNEVFCCRHALNEIALRIASETEEAHPPVEGFLR